MLKMILVVGLSLAGACGSSVEDLSGTHTSTDHFREYRPGGERVGDLQMTVVASGDTAIVSFAAPAADWKDPRGEKIPGPSPVPFLAQAGCKLTAKKSGKYYQLGGQVCASENRKLTIGSGSHVYMRDGVLYASISGSTEDGEYSLTYPLLFDKDEPLKAN
jgi:hypothetical protein